MLGLWPGSASLGEWIRRRPVRRGPVFGWLKLQGPWEQVWLQVWRHGQTQVTSKISSIISATLSNGSSDCAVRIACMLLTKEKLPHSLGCISWETSYHLSLDPPVPLTSWWRVDDNVLHVAREPSIYLWNHIIIFRFISGNVRDRKLGLDVGETCCRSIVSKGSQLWSHWKHLRLI